MEHSGILLLTLKKMKPKCNVFSDHLINCSYSMLFDEFVGAIRAKSKRFKKNYLKVVS